MRRLLQAAAAGAQRQAVHQLAGYDTYVGASGRQLAQLFGITRDLATASNWRPTGASVVALNQVMGGGAHDSRCAGPGCSEVTATAFGAGARWAMVSAAAQPLTVSWPCQATQRLADATGVARQAACVQGRAEAVLPAASWLTAVPLAASSQPPGRR